MRRGAMTPQSNIMVVAVINEGREAELRQALASMNIGPGVVDPDNSLVPFGRLTTLHFARFVILEDATRDDLSAYGYPRASAAKSLALLCDFDGPADVFLRELVASAGTGLVRLFSCCDPQLPSANLFDWLRAH